MLCACARVCQWPFLIRRLIKIVNYLELRSHRTCRKYSLWITLSCSGELKCCEKNLISDLLCCPLKIWFYIVPEICPDNVCQRGKVTPPWWLSRGRDTWKLVTAGARSQMMAAMWQDRNSPAVHLPPLELTLVPWCSCWVATKELPADWPSCYKSADHRVISI